MSLLYKYTLLAHHKFYVYRCDLHICWKYKECNHCNIHLHAFMCHCVNVLEHVPVCAFNQQVLHIQHQQVLHIQQALCTCFSTWSHPYIVN